MPHPTLPARGKGGAAAAKPKSGALTPHNLKITAGVVAVLALILLVIAIDPFADDDSGTGGAPAPRVSGGPQTGGESPIERPPVAETAEQLGFPAFATKNTTRVGGSDSIASAAGVALATFPSAGGSKPPEAVTIVGENDWQAGIAAAVLVADPISAPILISSSGNIPSLTEDALDALGPTGSSGADGAQVFAVGDVAVPGGLKTNHIDGGNPAAAAAAVERLHSQLVAGEPDHIVIASAEDAAYAMPAAAWAARSGDPVLFVNGESLPKPTAEALKRHRAVPVYVLGPESVISAKVVREIARLSNTVVRVGAENPVQNAIEFARFSDGSFGWNLNDPGHGFVVASTERPLDAAAAAPLSANGTWGALLLTDNPDAVPGPLRGYLLDVKPGYQSDPTRALYNHIWIIGDQSAVGVEEQATLDDLAELVEIRSGPGGSPEGESAPRGSGQQGGGSGQQNQGQQP
jgi:putative cell wall binding repeat protein